MNRKKLATFISLLTILSFLAAPVAAAPMQQEEPPATERVESTGGVIGTTGINPDVSGIDSLSGSTVTFTTDGPGDDMYIPGVSGTFYFVAHSLTNDWEYVYNVWMRFPADWTVTNVEVIGTPTCTGGGSWGTFSWSYETSPYEINIYHPRYQAYTDDCTATYAVTAVPGAPVLYADVAWYWDGDGYNAVPHHPCSAPGYTPPSMVAYPCDESVNPPAQVPTASMDPGVYLFPEVQNGGGCNGEPLTYDVSIYNNTGAAWTFDLSYSILDGLGTLTGPATIYVLDDEVADFEVVFTPDVCAIPDGEVIGEVYAEGNTYSDTAEIIHTVTSGGGWEQVPGSAPAWAGNGYLSDGCTAFNAAGEAVTYVIGDMSGTGPVGFWGYNHDTNMWFQPAAANTPVDRWAPDWAYDPMYNVCYLTGGANTPGAGTYNDAYQYNPVANSFTALPNFTSVRDFHDSWVGTVDSVYYLCIGGGNNGAGLTSTQCYSINGGAWAAENATIGAMPTDTWGAADGVLNDAGGDLFVSIAGAQTGSLISDAAWYWDDADNLWHSAGNTGLARYRVEGDFWDGEFYQVAGSDGTFTGTTGVRKGTWDGSAWTWTAFQDVANRRMDNVANTVDGVLHSIDGYGLVTPNYVEFYQGCPYCDLRGNLEGQVLDLDYNGGTQCSAPDSLTGSDVVFNPAAGGDTCYQGGLSGTYCFEAYSYSPDYAYAYNVWLRFPPSWTISDVYVTGTPTCNNGTWGSFSYTFETSPYEVNINHPRYMGSGGAECWATYCVVATPGAGSTDALASWYWAGDNYGSAPYHPCSSDVYTPASQSAAPCDEWVNPQAAVPSCGGAAVGPTCTPATVTINPGNLVVPVNPTTGAYGPVELIQGEYEVSAQAGGYTVDTATVVIIDEMTTTQDFGLGRPDIVVSDTSFNVASPYEVPLVETLIITNSGSEELEWSLLDFGAAGAVTAVPTTVETIPAQAGEKIDADLATQLAGGPADFFVWLAEKADLSGAANLETKEEKGEFVFNALTTVADRTQRELRSRLDQMGVDYEPFYIANKILIHNGDPALALEIAGRSDVYRLSANHTYQLDEPMIDETAGNTPAGIETNISYIYAPDVWAMGFTGDGIVLAGNDTGLQWDHPALINAYRGWDGSTADHNYNWWDATGSYPLVPTDGHGHGTHTSGTMVGDDGGANQIGVAPGAGLVHCKNMTDGGSGDDGTFSTCFQWDLAPWDLTGANPLPAMAPDAINNSWGYGGGNAPQFEDEIAALHAAGILVEVSAGNEGSGCGSLRSPGDYVSVLTTGSVSHELGAFPGPITGFSSRGPSALYPGEYFPDIMAPGNSIRSSVPGSAYEGGWGGTSMAGPHATALIALMWDAAPALRGDVASTIDIIHQTAEPLVGQGGSNCGGDYTVGPNNDWGFGTINALAAVQLAQESADLPWVTEDPTSGMLPPGGVQAVDLTFLCTVEQSGEHLLGTLRIESNDPCESVLDIPLDFYCQGVVGEPDIDINMFEGPLETALCPDSTDTIAFEICNIGTEPLTWDVTESNPVYNLASFGPAAPATRPVELSLSGAGGASVETDPPVVLAPVELVLDDGSRDNDIGLGGTIEILWVNRFTPSADLFPFELTEVQFYFSSLGLVNVGDDILIIVYENTTGGADPAVGSNLLATYPATIQALDVWNVYTLPMPVTFNGPGDVVIGAIGLETPGTNYWPASIDQTATQARSWAGWWNASPPPNPPVLPPENWTLIDAYFPGNWMVRGYGETLEPGDDVLWLSENPTAGTLAPDECVIVDVTFDSTGLLPGDYAAMLTVNSNDPQTPEVELPVTMTVWEPLSDVTFDWAPVEPVVDQQVDFTAYAMGEEPIDYAWDFGDGATGTGAMVSHTYAAAGDYEVILVVSNYCSVVTVSATIMVLDVPDITLDPTELASTQGPNQVVVETLDIGNVGESDLIWDIMESAGLPLGLPVANAAKAGTDSAPTSRLGAGTLALGDWLFDIEAEGAIGNNLLLGVEVANGSYWVTGGDPGGGVGLLYELDMTGALINTYSQASACTGWGGRDLAWDGTYLYYGCDNSLIYQVDPATGAPTGTTITGPISPPRALAYDPATDHFWTASWDSNIYEIDRAGVMVNSFAPVGLSTYGMAWDAYSDGGPFLWLWSQDGPDPLLMASQVNPDTGALTGVAFLGYGASGEMSGGATISDEVVDGIAVFVGMNQGVTDRIGVYDMDVSLGCQPGDFPWLSVTPDAGTTAPGATSTVDVTFDSTGLAVGTYEGFLCVNSNDPDEAQIPVPVTLEVTDAPIIVVDPLEITMDLYPDETGVVTITVTNEGSVSLNVDLWETIPWLSLDMTSFTVMAGQTQAVRVTFDATGMTPGMYELPITITSNDPANPSVEVTATLNVLDMYMFDLYLPIVNRTFTP